jgi:hypothetical protein
MEYFLNIKKNSRSIYDKKIALDKAREQKKS